MSRTASTMLALGTRAPDFELPDTMSGRHVDLNDVAGSNGLLVMFLSRHCPYVKHVANELARIGADYEGTGVGVVAISSNDAKSYPDDAPHLLKLMGDEMGYNFPFCYDESQSVAKAYTAACTPDFFLFDGDLALVYRGQLDDSRPGTDIPVTGRDLRNAIDALLAGTPISEQQKPSIGCNVKWKPGNEPDYFG